MKISVFAHFLQYSKIRRHTLKNWMAHLCVAAHRLRNTATEYNRDLHELEPNMELASKVVKIDSKIINLLTLHKSGKIDSKTIILLP